MDLLSAALDGCEELMQLPRVDVEDAAAIYRLCRRAGRTVRSPNDCLIAAIALEHGALLVHNDRDFVALAQVEPALVIFPGRPH